MKRRSIDTSICLNILRAFLRKFAALTNDMVNTFTSLVTHWKMEIPRSCPH